MDGKEVLRRVRTGAERVRHIPIVVFSSAALTIFDVPMADEFVEKSFPLEDYFSAVDGICAKWLKS